LPIRCSGLPSPRPPGTPASGRRFGYALRSLYCITMRQDAEDSKIGRPGACDLRAQRPDLLPRVDKTGVTNAMNHDVERCSSALVGSGIGQPKQWNPAMRHSEATNIEAEVEYSSGCGIDPRMLQSARAAHWGLLRMGEWAENISAQLRIWSRPGAGTEVQISVPCHAVTASCG